VQHRLGNRTEVHCVKTAATAGAYRDQLGVLDGDQQRLAGRAGVHLPYHLDSRVFVLLYGHQVAELFL